MIALTIDVSRINRARIFTSKTGKKYLSFILVDAPDQYGNAGQVAHSISKDERLAGGKGEVVGSWKILGANKPLKASPPAPTKPTISRSDDLLNSPIEALDHAQSAQSPAAPSRQRNAQGADDNDIPS
jgi:hypothetical protein